MDGVGMNEPMLTMVGADRTKKVPGRFMQKWGSMRVPTSVLPGDDREVVHVVERRLPANATPEGEIAGLLVRRP
jgi:hypothetical protein